MRQPPPGPDFDKCLPAWIAEFHEATGGYHRQTRGGKQTVVVRC